jgi:hypothetical protein
MSDDLNAVLYNAELQKLAVSFHSGNAYLDRFLRNPIALDDNYGKTYVFWTKRRQPLLDTIILDWDI